MQVYKDRKDSERTELELDTYKKLEELCIGYERVDHDAAATIADCELIDGELGTKMCKNLFLCNSQKTVFYLLLMPGDKHFKTKEVSHALGIARLSFAPEEFLHELMGLRPGAVTVLGLMNDKERKINLLIDKDIMKEEYLGCHPCVNTSSLKIKMSDILEKFLPNTGHKPTVIELKGE
ncbi:MAG: prolyl-tRNA synthetase associated domain-containing protein [Clostridia bacterium]|nr:prolyl-tRNA synthetase associated domain-containing protein [Clostridia bacterium]